MVQKEKASLWRIKHLLTKLSGDNTWYPCEVVETDNDFTFFFDERDRKQDHIPRKPLLGAEGDQISPGTLVSEDAESLEKAPANDAQQIAQGAGALHTEERNAGEDVVMDTSQHPNGVDQNGVESSEVSKGKEVADSPQENGVEQLVDDPLAGSMEVDEVAKVASEAPPGDSAHSIEDAEMADGEIGGDLDDNPAPRRMRTRAQAQAASDNNTVRTRSQTPESSDTFIHPIFLAPSSSRPDRNVGLPPPEADETRRLLQLYIQKQEEVCRGAQKVYDGLLKADRYRKLVMKWAKADGHVGLNRDMSDGEDWYDKEEWGLDEDLKKGQDEEEEDAATTAKKTRTRRQ